MRKYFHMIFELVSLIVFFVAAIGLLIQFLYALNF